MKPQSYRISRIFTLEKGRTEITPTTEPSKYCTPSNKNRNCRLLPQVTQMSQKMESDRVDWLMSSMAPYNALDFKGYQLPQI